MRATDLPVASNCSVLLAAHCLLSVTAVDLSHPGGGNDVKDLCLRVFTRVYVDVVIRNRETEALPGGVL